MSLPIPLPTQSYYLDATGASDQRLLNVYAEPTPTESGMKFILQGTPGLTLMGDALNGGPVRGMIQLRDLDTLFVSAGGLFRLNYPGAPYTVGDVDPTGYVTMATDGLNVIICCNNRAFLYNDEVTTEITDTLPFIPATVTWVEGYFVITSASQTFFISNLNSATEFDPLDFATAQASSGQILATIQSHLDLWFFSQDHAEIWYLSGDPTFPFQRQLGGVIEYGTASPESCTTCDNSVFWVGQDRKVYRANGYAPQCVSTPSVERWMLNRTINDALGMQISLEGHNCYVLTFPTEDWTWAYDSTNDKWYELSSGHTGVGRWRVQTTCLTNTAMLVGGVLDSKVYRLDKDAYTENGEPIFRTVTFPGIYGGGNPYFPTPQFPNDYGGGRRLFIERLGLDFFGSGETFTLTWSKDSGTSFTSPGRTGTTNGLRTFFTRLGSFRRLILSISGVWNGQFALYDAQADVDGGQW